MHHSLPTLTPHADITKFELEDGIMRGVVAALLSEPSSIAEIIVDMPRDGTDNLPVSAPSATDNALLAITASSESDAAAELDELVSPFAVVSRAGIADRIEVVERERTWHGTATPGVALRLRADRAPGIDVASFTHWATDSLANCAVRLPNSGIRAMVATVSESPLSSVSASVIFDRDEDLRDALTDGALAAFTESELIAPDSLSIDMVTEHRVSPNPNAWG